MSLGSREEIKDVLLCEDHPFVQMGVEITLKASLVNMVSLRKAGRGQQALQMAKERKPDLVVADLGLPDMAGVDLIKALKKIYPDLKVVVLTNCDNPTTLNEVRAAGVMAILQKSTNSDHFELTLKRIFSSKGTDLPILDGPTQHLLSVDPRANFTPRELEVLQEVVLGRSNQQIADKLGCALTTVRFHRANILDKAGVRNAAELTAWYLKGQGKGH